MDITRLPVTPLGRPASASPQGNRHTASVEAVTRVAFAEQRSRVDEPRERVVEGELLQRRPVFYQSTRAFIDERNLQQARPAGEPVALPQQSRLAIARYSTNVGAESVAGLAQGSSVNLFV
ncbi:MAG: hypothetical protein J5I92_07110 [Thiogranum sp.]|nr:hypothetical protein [Thiogranum sp.]